MGSRLLPIALMFSMECLVVKRQTGVDGRPPLKVLVLELKKFSVLDPFSGSLYHYHDLPRVEFSSTREIWIATSCFNILIGHSTINSWTVSYLSHSFIAYNGSLPLHSIGLVSPPPDGTGHGGQSWSCPFGRRPLLRLIPSQRHLKRGTNEDDNLEGVRFTHLLSMWGRGGEVWLGLLYRPTAAILVRAADDGCANNGLELSPFISVDSFFVHEIFSFCMEWSEGRLNTLPLSCILVGRCASAKRGSLLRRGLGEKGTGRWEEGLDYCRMVTEIMRKRETLGHR